MTAGPGMTGIDLTEETIFTWGAPPLKFGAGAVDEIGFEMAQFGARRVLILTDPRISELGIPARIADSLTKHGITSEVFDGVHVEPTDDSMNKATEYARAVRKNRVPKMSIRSIERKRRQAAWAKG